jgi:hypothetical protein
MRLGLPAAASSDSVKSISLWELVNTKPPPEPDYWAKKPSFWPKKPSLFARSIKLAKLGLMALGILSVGALAGIGNYFLNGVSGTPLFATEDTQSLASESTAPPVSEDFSIEELVTAADELPPLEATPESPTASPNERLAALLDQPETPASVVPPAILKQVSMFRTPAPREEAPSPAVNEAQPLPSDDVRLPRSRPDEPIITGSIRRSTLEPQQAADRKAAAKPSRWQRFGPCAALRSLKVPYLFGNRCGRYTRYDPPPPRQGVRVVAEPAPAPAPARQYSPQPYQPPRVVED